MSRRAATPRPQPEQSAAASPDAERRIPAAVIKRLSLYSRALQTLERNKVEKISSTDLAKTLGLNSAQVRKDLAYFGQFGVPGFGYPVGELRQNLKRILGTDKEISVALIGVGHLGKALLSYGGFTRQGFRILCAFDVDITDPFVGPEEVPVYHMNTLAEQLRRLDIRFVILTVPAEAAQGVAEQLTQAGVTAILNFVPVRLRVPEHVKIHYVDLALEMESLSYYLR